VSGVCYGNAKVTIVERFTHFDVRLARVVDMSSTLCADNKEELSQVHIVDTPKCNPIVVMDSSSVQLLAEDKGETLSYHISRRARLIL
jgi:hypothetical protein